jgi:hypothetical protein
LEDTLNDLIRIIDDSGASRLQIARHAGVVPRRLYNGEHLRPDEITRIHAVLRDVAAGKIAPRAGRSQAVPA